MTAACSADGTKLLTVEKDSLLARASRNLAFHDLESGTSRSITTHGNQVKRRAVDERGEIIVTGDAEGVIRVGKADGSEPHLLFGHKAAVRGLTVSPDGRWIASGGDDGDPTVRLWPMPDLSRPPLHTLPRDELIAKLKTLTNLRVVRDEASPSGWKLDIGPFPGWAEVPSW